MKIKLIGQKVGCTYGWKKAKRSFFKFQNRRIRRWLKNKHNDPDIFNVKQGGWFD